MPSGWWPRSQSRHNSSQGAPGLDSETGDDGRFDQMLGISERFRGYRQTRSILANRSTAWLLALQAIRVSNPDTDAGHTAHRLPIISTPSRTMDLCPNYSRTVPSRPRLQTLRAAARQPCAQSAGAAPRFPPRIGHSREKCQKNASIVGHFSCMDQQNQHVMHLRRKNTGNMPQFWCIFRTAFSNS